MMNDGDKPENVVPFEQRKKMGIETEIDAWFQDASGNRITYRASFWVRKDEVTEVVEAHQGQTFRSILFLRNAKAVNSMDHFNVIVARLEGR